MPLQSSDFTTIAGTPTWTWSQVTFPWATTVKLTNNSNYASNIIYCQSDLTWVTNSGSEDIAWIILSSNATMPAYGIDTLYSAKITSRSASWWEYRLFIGTTSYNMYDNSPWITKGKSIKITYNIATNDIKFWYWNGSAWTQMGTTQTYNIKNGWSLYFHLFYDIIVNNIGLTTLDNIYFWSVASDYSTQYPPVSTTNSGFFSFL